MAGHDNCHYDSYGDQLVRLWRPVWEAAGMDLVFQVRTTALRPGSGRKVFLFVLVTALCCPFALPSVLFPM